MYFFFQVTYTRACQCPFPLHMGGLGGSVEGNEKLLSGIYLFIYFSTLLNTSLHFNLEQRVEK